MNIRLDQSKDLIDKQINMNYIMNKSINWFLMLNLVQGLFYLVLSDDELL